MRQSGKSSRRALGTVKSRPLRRAVYSLCVAEKAALHMPGIAPVEMSLAPTQPSKPAGEEWGISGNAEFGR
eukprot:5075801-Pyramimonas_sp.AAC.2